MADKLPHMPLWVYDLEADEDCALMSLAEYGAYMRLLQRQWIEGSIPVDMPRLARLLRVTADEINAIWPALADKFVKDGRGRQKNHRLDQERVKAIKKVEKNRANGSLGGRPKETKSESEIKPNGSIRASGSDSESGSGSGSSGGSAEGGDAFDAFWAGVPNKLGKGTARKAYASAIAGGAAHSEIMAGLPGYRDSEKRRSKQNDYQPLHPATWLNGERWTDEHGTAKDAAKAAWESLGRDKCAQLLREVQESDSSVDHRAGNIETQRAMRRLAKEKGWM